MPDVAAPSVASPSKPSGATPTAEKPKSKTRRKPRSSGASASSSSAAAAAKASSATSSRVPKSIPVEAEASMRKKKKEKKDKEQVKSSLPEAPSAKPSTKPKSPIDEAAKSQGRGEAKSKGGYKAKGVNDGQQKQEEEGAASSQKARSRPRRPKGHKKRADVAGARGEDKALGVNALKAQIRQTKRFLARPKVAQDKAQEAQRRLVALERALEERSTGEKERGNATRYHKIRFFERQKLVRRIRQLSKELGAAVAASDKKKQDVKEAQLREARVLLNYVLHYPLTQKYVALFPLGQVASSADEGTHDVLSLFLPSSSLPLSGVGEAGEKVEPPSWLAEDANRLASWRRAKSVRDDISERMREGDVGDRPEDEVGEMGSAGVRSNSSSSGGGGVKRKAEREEEEEGDAIVKGQQGDEGEKKKKRRKRKGAASESQEAEQGATDGGRGQADKKGGLEDDDFFAMGDDDDE